MTSATCGWRMAGAFEAIVSAVAEPDVAPPIQVWQRPIAAAAALVIAAIAGGMVWGLVRPAPAPAGTVTRLPFILPEGDVMGIGDGMALSPDGRTLVYAAERDGVQQLFVRLRDQMTVRPLGGTEGALHPFFSPDGARVGFFADDALKKVALAGGPPVTLCAAGIRRGATWGPDNTIVFASADAPGLMQVSDAGDEPRPLTEPSEGTSHGCQPLCQVVRRCFTPLGTWSKTLTTSRWRSCRWTPVRSRPWSRGPMGR